MIAIISDIHANLAALQSVLNEIESLNCDEIICLGDVTGYGPQPAECIELLRANEVVCIKGNHDHYVSTNSGCPRSRLVSEISEKHHQMLTSQQIRWLEDSSEFIVRGRAIFTHGGPRDYLEQYLYKVSEQDIPEQYDFMFTGHTHVQALFKWRHKQYCNPGSVGQPRDGNPNAAFATFDGDSISLHRVAYDIDSTVREMKRMGFEKHYYENLYIGAQIGGRIDSLTQELDELTRRAIIK